MLLTADWVLPVAAPPIKDGGVLVRGSHIVTVGRAEDIRGETADEEHPFPGCALIPGLVNAHTHLSLAVLEGLFEPKPLPEWIASLVAVTRAMSPDDHAVSASIGALRALASGATVVGDIAYGPEPLAASADLGLGGTFFWEVLGATRSELPERLAASEFPRSAASCGPRAVCGLSPHSPYTCGPDLLRETAAIAREAGGPLAVHVAESPEEMRLMVCGDGPLAPLARRLAVGFKTPRSSPVAYLSHLGVLRDAVAVHCVHLASGDPKRLAAEAAGAVLCPTSNVFLHNGTPPVAKLRDAGVKIAVGTDSAASAPGAHPFGEVRKLQALDPRLSAEEALATVTRTAATILRVGDRFGSLREGLQADVVAMGIGAADDPVEAVVSRGGPDRVQAVMAGGVWRVLDGRPATDTDGINGAARALRNRLQRVRESAENPSSGQM